MLIGYEVAYERRRALVEVHPEKMSGTPCFAGTRVPTKHVLTTLRAVTVSRFETMWWAED